MTDNSNTTTNYRATSRTSYDADLVKDPNKINNGRFFAYYDHTASQPTHIIGWIDKNISSKFPNDADLLPLSADDWDWRDVQNSGVLNGKIVYYVQPDNAGAPVTASITVEAKRILNKTAQYLYQNYGMVNEPTPQEWVDYIKKLQAIANGTDSTSTTLPNPPKEN